MAILASVQFPVQPQPTLTEGVQGLTVASSIVLILYLAIYLIICVYGGHRYWMVYQYFRGRRRVAETGGDRLLESLPRVTIQLPMFNEAAVAERVIEAACAIDYPPNLLQIQVLDDSTDECASIALACCERLREAGHDIEFVHRDNRTGFKAGALEAGMASATGEFIAVFDADFVPPSDVINRLIHRFADEQVGMVQARWSHLNREQSMLTELQSMYLDGHFVVEQTARAGNGLWINFNGTAGIWRKSCIEDAGGWSHDTLTEDSDLSFRAQLKGWRFVYVPEVDCPAEVPPTVGAFLGQQHRWNKGLIQTALKLMPAIMKSDAPDKKKVEAWFHLTTPLMYPVILLLAVLVTPAIFVDMPGGLFDSTLATVVGLVFLCGGVIAATMFYVVSQAVQGRSIWHTVLRLPALMALGVGISVVNTRAVFEALLGKSSPFVRTPKFAGQRASSEDPVARTRRRLPAGVTEATLGVAMLVCVGLAFMQPFTMIGVPFMAMFAAGFLFVGGSGILRTFRPAG